MADRFKALVQSLGAPPVYFNVGYWLNADGATYSLGVNIQGGSITVKPQTGSYTDRSGTIAAPATSQQVMAANANRKKWLLQNVSTDVLWINFTAVANQNQPSIKVLPNQIVSSDDFLSTEAINIIGPTAGAAYTAKEA